MEFEDILKDVGGFDLYQKILVIVFVIPTFLVIPWFSMVLIFMSTTPDHWCYVPEVANSNLSVELQKQVIRYPSEESCYMYDINYTELLQTGNLTEDPLWPSKPCDKGWQYDTTFYDETAVTRWNLVCHDAHYSSLVLSMIFIGTIFGTSFYGFLSDKIGRKPTFFFLASVVAVSEICSTFSPYFILFLFLTAAQGSVMSSIYSSGYVIVLELVHPEIRSWVNGIATTSWTLGLCLLPLVAWLTRNWVHLSMVTALCAASLWLYWRLLPESPRWLISEGRYNEAHAILAKVSTTNGKKAHEGNQLMRKIQMIGEKIKNEKASEESHSPLSFFRYPTLRKRFLLVTVCWIGVSITYYGLQVNVKNLTGNQFINFFLVSLVEIPSHLAAWFFMDRIGRRWCTVFSFMICALACLIPVVLPEDYHTAGIAASLLGKTGVSSAFMMLYQQSPEIFPTSLRCLGMAMSSTVGLGSTLLMPYIVYLAEFGTSLPFLVFSIISCLSGVCSSFLPETLNKNLPQTAADADSFEKHFDYFSCSQRNTEIKLSLKAPESSWTPAELSATNLYFSNKAEEVAFSSKKAPVLTNFCSTEITKECLELKTP